MIGLWEGLVWFNRRGSTVLSYICTRCCDRNPEQTTEFQLTENSFRHNIAFANELSLICAELDIDVWTLSLPIAILVSIFFNQVRSWWTLSCCWSVVYRFRCPADSKSDRRPWDQRCQATVGRRTNRILRAKVQGTHHWMLGPAYKPNIDDLGISRIDIVRKLWKTPRSQNRSLWASCRSSRRNRTLQSWAGSQWGRYYCWSCRT